MTKKFIYLLLVVLSITHISCEKDTDDSDDIISDGGEITADIDEDMTFKTGTVYIFDGTIRIRNAKLTFEAGSIIKFTEGSSLEFAYWGNEYATIEVLGTSELPVLFTSNNTNAAAGDWDGLHFYDGSTECTINHAIVEYAGGDETYGSVFIEESEIALTNSVIREASNVGIRLKTNGSFSAFGGNSFLNIDSYPISIYINNVHTLTGSNVFETATGIWIEDNEDFTLQGEYSWTDLGVPFYQEGTIRFGAEGEGSIVNIAPGTEILFMEDARWDIAYWGVQYATLVCEGTSEKPILFSSASTNPQAGDWECIAFYSGANHCSFDYTTIEFGGSNDFLGMVMIEKADVSFTNCEFYYSQSIGIKLFQEASFTDFGNNTFLGHMSYPISIFPNYVHTIKNENSFTTDHGIFISDTDDLNIEGDYTWTQQSAPYILDGDLRIGAEGNGVNLTIEPGCIFKFTNQAQLDIAYWGAHNASIIANGTSEKPIVFTSINQSPLNNDWDGIHFYGGSHNSSISYSTISYAGGLEKPWGAITLRQAGSPLALSNTHISHIDAHGISVDEDSSVDIDNNVTFEDINGSNYYVR